MLNTRSNKLDPVNGGGVANSLVATTPSDGWVISPPAGQQFDERLLLVMFFNATENVTVKAGTRYPAQRADLGDMTVAGTSGDVRYIVIETSRFMKSDGTIVVTGINASGTLTAVMLPKAP